MTSASSDSPQLGPVQSQERIVLLDVNMPRMDGFTLLEQLNEFPRDLETVIVSAYGDMRNILTAMNRGAFDFITKPVNFVLLGYRWQYMLRSRRILEEVGTNEQRLETAQLQHRVHERDGRQQAPGAEAVSTCR